MVQQKERELLVSLALEVQVPVLVLPAPEELTHPQLVERKPQVYPAVQLAQIFLLQLVEAWSNDLLSRSSSATLLAAATMER